MYTSTTTNVGRDALVCILEHGNKKNEEKSIVSNVLTKSNDINH